MKRRHWVHRGVRRVTRILWALLQRIGYRTTDWIRSRPSSGYRKPPSTAWCYTLQPLEPRLLLSADLIGGTLSHDALTPVIPGEPVSALVEVYRPDSEPLANPVRIKLYASTDSVLDAKDALVGQTDVAADKLNPGNNAIKVSLDTRAIAQPGSYRLIGVIDPDNLIAESDETNNQSLASSSLFLEFAVGQIPGRSPVPSLDLTDADGTHLTLTIAGPGLARLTPNGSGYDFNLSGTDASTRVELAGSGGDGRLTLTGISADSPLGSLLAPLASLAGTASFRSLNSLSLGDIAAGALLEGDSLASLNVTRDALGNLHLSGVGASGFVLGSAQVGGAIGGLWSVSGRANTISAQSTRADWRANISKPLSQLVIRGDASGQFAAEALQLLQVGGSLKGMSLRIGANLGSDAVIGGSGDAADHFGPGTLARLRVTGDIEDSLIVIGIDPHNGSYLDGDDLQLGTPTRRVQELLVGGRLAGTTQISAPAFPASVRINGVVRTPASLSELATTPPDRSAPTLSAALLNDSGLSASDRISRDASISGQASDAGGVTHLLAALDPGDTPSFVDLSSALQADGRFVLTPALLDTLAGGTLADGTHSVRLVAQDAAGNASTSAAISFTLDATPPATPSFGLSLASDTGALGDGDTEAARVTLVGSGEADADLLLIKSGSGDTSGVASSSGRFFLPDIDLVLGDNTFTLRAIDAAGNVAETNLLLHRSSRTTSSDLVMQWNDIALTAIRLDASAPPVATRGLAMLSIAVLDTVNAFEGTPGFYVSRSAPAGASLDAAIAAAAQRVLAYLYPGQQASFDAALAAALAGIADGAAKSDGIALGRAIADDIIALRKGDGFDDFVDFTGSSAPGQWQASAPMYAVALLPQWADLQPFAMSSPSEFRPPAPPALDSATYTADFTEVKALGSATGSTRSAEQTQIARFWADGAGTDTPPGHWNRIAATLATAQGNSLAANARLFAQLNVALADASITAWDAKYHYTAWRPITAIREADTDGNDATAVDAAWTSLLITPPFPEYVSGHSTYSGAAEAVLASAFGASTAFTIDSEGLPGIERSFANFHDAAEEAGRSRIYGGIHFEFANQAGLAAGRLLGQKVLDTFASSTDTQAPKLLLDQSDGLVSGGNVTLGGRVLDALSGVAVLQGAFDAATPAPIAFDADGRFSVSTAIALDGSADGVHTLTLSAVDARGNASAPLTFSFTLDTRAPEIALTSLAEGDTLSAASRLTGTADPTGSTLVSLGYAFDGGRTIPVSFDPATGQFDTDLDLAALGVGAHTLSLAATDAAGHSAVSTLNLTLPELIPLTITKTTPSDGADDVGATFKPQVFFSRPVDVTTLTDSTFYATDTTGAKLAATIVPAQDGTFAWLFLKNPLPGASTITIHVVGDGILAGDGQALDADGDGTAGGTLTSRFTTVSVTPIAGTTITGRLLDPGDDLKPMTFDDIRAGADGALHTADDVFLHPIAGAKVFILGLEGNVVYTDANGYFHLDQVPAGNVKLAIDGRTATNAPAGSFYPEMVMDLTIEVGYDNTVMGSMGTREAMAANEDRQEVYLPRLQTAILQTVSGTENTEVGVDAVSAPNLTDEQRAQLKLEVQPGTLIDADGHVMASGQVGISTVPPELVRDMLPPGVSQHTFDITIQAPGVAAFAKPLEITFPNVFNAAPGTKLNFLSFDHTTGRLVIEGTATVSADGKSVTTDPGMGVSKPGWHGLVALGMKIFFYPLTFYKYIINMIQNFPNDHCVEVFVKVGGPFAQSVVASAGLVAAFVGSPWIVASVNAISYATILKDIYDSVRSSGGLNDASLKGLVGFFRGFLSKELDPQDPSPIFKGVPSDVTRMLNGFAGKLLGALNVFDAAIDTLGTARLHKLDIAKCLDQLGLGRSPISRLAADEAPLKVISEGESFDVNYENVIVHARDLVEKLLGVMNGLIETWSSINRIDDTRDTVSADARILKALAQVIACMDIFSAKYPSDVNTHLLDLSQKALGLQNDFREEYSYFFDDSYAKGNWVLSVRTDDGIDVYQSYGYHNTDSVILDVGRSYIVEAANLEIGHAGSQALRIDEWGAQITQTIASTPLDKEIDSDNDGLPDKLEAAFGTSSQKRDTDSDGLSDAAEIASGSDPLGGRSLPTGIVSTLPLAGQAKAIVLEGSTTSAETQTGYVATGTYGLAIVNASSFRQPIVLSQIDLPGDAVDVSVDSRLGIAAVATTAGLQLVDVSDPAAPRLLRSVNVPATQVEVLDGIAYVAAGAGLEGYSVQTGELLQVLPLGGATLTGLAREGQTLYTMDVNRTLRVVDVSGLQAQGRGSLSLPAGNGKLFVGNGVAYVGAGNGDTGGFITVDVSNPGTPRLISGVDANNVHGQTIVANGSGLAIAVGNLFNFGNQPGIDVLDVRDPANTAGFVTRFALPTQPYDVAIGAGIAFVAGGTGGLMVVNYQAFDTKGQAPSVTLAVMNPDADPGKPGLQLQEGSYVGLRAAVGDDQQVRNVELLINGQVVRNDVGFPWDFTAPLPTLAEGNSTVTLELRATDTGGNRTLSIATTIDLVPDSFAPTIVDSNLADGSRHGHGFRTVELRFSEAMDPASVAAANFWLVDTSGSHVNPTDAALGRDGRTVTLTFDPLAVGHYALDIAGNAVKDRAGNVLAAGEVSFRQFNIANATIAWVAPGDGDWSNPANWDLGRVPSIFDDVLIDMPAGGTVTINGATVRISNIEAFNPLAVRSSELTVDNGLVAHDNVLIRNSNLLGSTVSIDAGKLMTVQAAFFDRVTVNGDMIVDESTLTVRGLTLNGRMTVASLFHGGPGAHTNVSSVLFDGTQELAGSGEVVFFDGGFGESNYFEMSKAGELTIGAGITVRGSAGIIGGHLRANAPMMRLVNNGRILADAGGNGSLSISADSMVNHGSLGSSGSGRLFLSNSWTSPGGSLTLSGGTVDLGGVFDTAGFGGVRGVGGTLRISGTVENGGGILALDGTSTWQLTGLIRGGVVTVQQGQELLAAGGQIEGVTINGDVLLNESRLFVKGMTLNGTMTLLSKTHYPDFGWGVSELLLLGSQTWDGNGQIVFTDNGAGEANFVEMVQSGQLTIGTGLTLRGWNGVIGGHRLYTGTMTDFINHGAVIADVGSSFLSISASQVTNDGVLRATNGATLSFPNFAANQGTVSLGVGGRISVSGSFENAPTGSVQVAIAGPASSQYGHITVSGNAALDGNLNVTLDSSFVPTIGQTFAIVTYGSHAGSFALINDADPGDGVTYTATYNPTNLTLSAVA